jgi:hypothetical protein
MEYVGWRDVKSALRYIENVDPFGSARIERAIAAQTSLQVANHANNKD